MLVLDRPAPPEVTDTATRSAFGESARSPKPAGSPTMPASWPARFTHSRRLFCSVACEIYARSPACDMEKSTRPRLCTWILSVTGNGSPVNVRVFGENGRATSVLWLT